MRPSPQNSFENGARLNKIQDIAGARIVVPRKAIQQAALEIVLDSLSGLAPEVTKDSRELGDELGYRAVHVVVRTTHEGIGERFAEIQIRTEAENLWAQTVETLDAILGSDLKHGQGPAEFKSRLLEYSEQIGSTETSPTFTLPKAPPIPPSR